MPLPKFNPPLGKAVIVSFKSNLPDGEGTGQWGSWKRYEVISDGSEYSFFPSKMLLPEIEKKLASGVMTLVVEKSAKQAPGGKIITSWAVSDPKLAGIPTPITPVVKFEAELNQSTMQAIKDDKDHQIARSVALKASVDFYSGRQCLVEDVLITAEQFEKWLWRK